MVVGRGNQCVASFHMVVGRGNQCVASFHMVVGRDLPCFPYVCKTELYIETSEETSSDILYYVIGFKYSRLGIPI